MKTSSILFLSSGVALGVYVPPLIMSNQLRAKGINTEFFVIENLIHENKLGNILMNKYAFHRSFKTALVGQKLSEKSDYGIDNQKVQLLYDQWDKIRIKKFLVFSGFWASIIDYYLETRKLNSDLVDLCHLDAAVSSSWKNHDSIMRKYRNVWFFNLQKTTVNYQIKVTDTPLVDFKDRSRRFVIHGGGWGMGTYREKMQELNDLKIRLDIINYEPHDLNNRANDNRNFMIDPEWKTWEKKSNGEYAFPPFAQINDNLPIRFDYNAKYPGVYDLIRNSYGIISKPGGATLMDSFSSATPIIFLEPFGDYEEANAMLWKRSGFGVDYNHWISMGCSTDLLWQMHNKLKKAILNTKNIMSLYV